MNKTLKNLLKGTAYTLAGISLGFSGLLVYVGNQNSKIERQFHENILSSGVNAAQLAQVAPGTQNFTLDKQAMSDIAMGSMLVYQCAPLIAHKAEHVKNSDGHAFLYHEKGKTNVWDSCHQEYAELDDLYSTQDHQKTQLASFYNQKTNEVIWAWGGTDFSSLKDLMAGGQTIAGGLADRVLSADKLVDSVLCALKEKFPAVDPQTVRHVGFMHSTGAQSYAASCLGFAKNNIRYSEAYNIDGFGAGRPFHALAESLSSDPSQSLDLFKKMTRGIVAVKAQNEMDIVGDLKKVDPFDWVGHEKGAANAVGGHIVDVGQHKHRAFGYAISFEKKAKL